MADLIPLSQPISLPIADQPAERSDAAANRQRILDAAREVLAANGPEGLSMNAVACQAGVGKGTIFRRFGDRDGLLESLIHTDTVALQDAFLSGPPPLGPGAPPLERLEAFLRALVVFKSDHIELLLAEARLLRLGAPADAALLLHLRALIEQLDPRLDAAVVSTLLYEATGARSMWRLLRSGADPSRIADGLIALAHGLVTER